MASIKERNGTYQITVSMGRDVYGKQILKYANYTPEQGLTPKKRQKAVEAFAFDFEQRCLNGQLLEGEKITLNDFITRWTAEKAQQELQPQPTDSRAGSGKPNGTAACQTSLILPVVRQMLGNGQNGENRHSQKVPKIQ